MSTIVYEGFEQGFGEEYPAALNRAGIRCPLIYETRFIRHYHVPEPRLPRQGSEREISRFVDGSASVTLRQLEAEWMTWTDPDRMDFCQSIDVLLLLALRTLFVSYLGMLAIVFGIRAAASLLGTTPG